MNRSKLGESLRLFLLLLGVLLAILLADRGFGALGEPVDSVESDRRALSAVRGRTTAQGSYTIHEIEYNGIAVREYVSPSGVVFAVTWSGIRHPDLSTLLGSYTDQYQKAVRQLSHRPGARRLSVEADGVIVEKWGHVRDLRGRAYAPELIPSGVTADEIK